MFTEVVEGGRFGNSNHWIRPQNRAATPLRRKNKHYNSLAKDVPSLTAINILHRSASALGERNKILLRKKFSRSQLLAYTAKLPAWLIGVEACAGAHFLGGKLREPGHQVRLIAAQFVKP